MNKLSFAAVALLASVAATPAWSNILTFDGDICGPAGDAACGNFGRIGQNYGDVAGVVDVIYNRDVTAANSDASLSFWDTAYSDLTNVAWGANNDSSGRAEIFLKPLDGRGITLDYIDIGSYRGDRDTQMSFLSGAGVVLSATPIFTVGFGSHTRLHFFSGLTSADGIRIQWGPSAYNIGVDNVSFTTGAVPEPETYAFIGAGLVMAGMLARRRRVKA